MQVITEAHKNSYSKICSINGIRKVCDIDLGSDCSLIKESEAASLGLKLESTNKILTGFNNSISYPMAYSDVNIIIDKIEFNIEVYILSDDHLSKQILLGKNILQPGVFAVVHGSGIEICKSRNGSVLCESRSVLKVESVKIERPIEEKDIKYGKIDEEDKKSLIQLLNSHRQSIAFTLDELGKASIGEMKIDLNDEEPVYHRSYRMSIMEREKLNELINKLQKNNIIRESTSPYASPAFLVL